MSVETWSFRLRPVWILPPAGPIRSMRPRSIAIWMSSSDGTNRNVPARISSRISPRASMIRAASSGGTSPCLPSIRQ